ncbi:YqaA family protein [Azovibrio restrictus]|uniref:YqaA family protein n=1 Tax=Azovibrio restrictus TaxID=146938 RepID=UPI0026EC2854|nr:YqaA family protein [Azovibrio restrictus]MDD3482083.1 DedA family protein [Azovibrio restrictus]
MEWLNVTAEQGLWGIFLSSFLSATVLPGGSELLLFGFLKLHPEQFWPALGLATLGNSLGGMSTYACGRFLPKWQRLEQLPHRDRLERRGPALLLLSWAPVIGDALCLCAGWLKLNWLSCLLFMAVGKALRYALVAQGSVW